jgi:hypothetical protein
MTSFDLDFDLLPADADDTPATALRTVVPVVTAQVTVTQTPSQAASYVMRPEDQWGWNDLRDYVIREIERVHGPQPRDPRKESSIFKSFIGRHGAEKAVAIAKAAFGPAHQGMWRGAPISVNRFCLASDPFFADVISERL